MTEYIQEKRINQDEVLEAIENEFDDLQLNAEAIEDGKLQKQKDSIFVTSNNESLQLNKIRVRRVFLIPIVPKGLPRHRAKNMNLPIKKIYKTIHAYSSGNVGTFIVDAVDNYTYGIKVGSKFEDLFFSVRCTEMYSKPKNAPFDLVTFYFRNPEAYEALFFVNLSPAVKNAWMQKFKRAEKEYLEMTAKIEQHNKYIKQQLALSESEASAKPETSTKE